jgi:hypothetical protein
VWGPSGTLLKEQGSYNQVQNMGHKGPFYGLGESGPEGLEPHFYSILCLHYLTSFQGVDRDNFSISRILLDELRGLYCSRHYRIVYSPNTHGPVHKPISCIVLIKFISSCDVSKFRCLACSHKHRVPFFQR